MVEPIRTLTENQPSKITIDVIKHQVMSFLGQLSSKYSAEIKECTVQQIAPLLDFNDSCFGALSDQTLITLRDDYGSPEINQIIVVVKDVDDYTCYGTAVRHLYSQLIAAHQY